ncbi:MAG: redoxin domain-containing protein [bacterium]
MRSARTLAWESAYHLTGGGQEGRCSYRIWLKKPGFGRMEAVTSDQVTGVIVGDGESFWIYWPAGFPGTRSWDPGHPPQPKKNLYMQRNFAPDRYSFSHDATKLGSCLMMTVLQPSVFHGQEATALEIDSASMLGTEIVSGQMCDVVELGFADGQRSVQYWIAKADHLPRRLEAVARLKEDLVVEEAWSSIRIDDEISDDLFRWSPPDGWTEYFEPDLETQLLPSGTAAPDFEAPLLHGGVLRLSDQQGKVVVLNFWRVGCPPCRRELPILQRLHHELRDDGLVVIGVDTIDDRERLSTLLDKSGALYPCIWDTSEAGEKIRADYEPAQDGADPLTYVIGRDGKVVSAWYGFAEDRLEESLAQAGVELK